jgi:hypothetical protein
VFLDFFFRSTYHPAITKAFLLDRCEFQSARMYLPGGSIMQDRMLGKDWSAAFTRVCQNLVGPKSEELPAGPTQSDTPALQTLNGASGRGGFLSTFRRLGLAACGDPFESPSALFPNAE